MSVWAEELLSRFGTFSARARFDEQQVPETEHARDCFQKFTGFGGRKVPVFIYTGKQEQYPTK